MEFAYQARDNQGVLRTGTVEAVNESSAFNILQNHGLIVIKMNQAVQYDFLDKISIFSKVPMKDVVLFSRQLATLIDAKVPIVQALRILQTQVSSHHLQVVIEEITQKVESGDSLSTALAEYPGIFNNLYINLVRSGELSGTLGEILIYLANQLEKDYDLRSKIIGSLTYPAFIISALVIVGFLMFIFVLPPLVSVLQEAKADLPITTKILIAVTNILQNYWWLVIAVMISSGVGIRLYLQTYAGRYLFDYAKINIPVFGKLFEKIYMARFSRNLSTLVAGGIPIVKALESVAEIVGNQVYRDIILDAAGQVRNGKSIASALLERPEFPSIVSQMTQIGESTGRLHDILDKLAQFYEKEVEGVLKTITTLIEPLIMIIIGLAVSIMVAGILLPIYNLASAV